MTTYRSANDNIAAWISTAVIMAFCIWGLTRHFSVAWFVIMAVAALLLAIQLGRRVVVDEAGVSHRTLFRAKAVPWSAVTSCDSRHDPGDSARNESAKGSAYVLTVHTAAGEPLRIRYSRWSRRHVAAVLADLQAELHRRGQLNQRDQPGQPG